MSTVFFAGTSKRFKLPSGKEVTVREINGDDEEKLSTVKNAEDGLNAAMFLSSIITHDHDISDEPSIVTADAVFNWHRNDIFALLYLQRLVNQGNTMEFKFKPNTEEFKDIEAPVFTEELPDISEKIGLPAFIKQGLTYPEGKTKQIEFKLSSGKQLRFNILTGFLEHRSLQTPIGTYNKNSPLYDRDLELLDEGKWVKVVSFHAFNAKEMTELRSMVKKKDPRFDPLVQFTCPLDSQFYSLQLMQMPAFFYPEEAI